MKRIILLTLLLMIFSAISYAEGLSIGLGYPYISLKYDFAVMSLEGRFVSDPEAKAYSGRSYWNYYSDTKLRGFTGLEGGYISLDTEDTKGTGYEAALFIGGEYFITNWLSLLLDLAPTFISLTHSDDSSVNINGIEFVGNIGLYLHFGSFGNKDEEMNYEEVEDEGEDVE